MKKILCFIIAALGTLCSSHAQDRHNVDSLEKLLSTYEAASGNSTPEVKPPKDTLRCDILYSLSKEYWSGDLDTAMLYANQLLLLSDAIHFPTGMGNALNSIGVVHWYRGEYKDALDYMERSLKVREQVGEKKNLASSYNNIGLIYDDQGNFPEALDYYFKALKYYEAVNDSSGISQALNNIGMDYWAQKNQKDALAKQLEALAIRQKIGDKWGLTESYSNIGLIYDETKDSAQALKYYTLALKLREEIGDIPGIAVSFNNLGAFYRDHGNFDAGLLAFQRALKIDEEMGYKKSVADVSNQIGVLYEMQGKKTEALAQFTKAYRICKELGAGDYLVDTYEHLSRINASLGNFQEAYRYQVLFKQTNDSLFNSDKNKELTRNQFQYDYDKKHLSDSLKFAQHEQLGALKLQRQRAFTYGGFSGLLVVVILLFFAYRNYSKQRIANRKLKEAQKQLIESEKMAAFGTLTSRIAHEIQNPLNFVNNFSQLSAELIGEVKATSSKEEMEDILNNLKDLVRKTYEHGKRADGIVKKLQAHIISGTAHEFFDEPKFKSN